MHICLGGGGPRKFFKRQIENNDECSIRPFEQYAYPSEFSLYERGLYTRGP